MSLSKRWGNNRNTIAHIRPNMLNNIGLKNPAAIAWWSAAFPGFGHMIIGSHFVGFILLIHEALLNNLSGLNTAIFYSFIGDFNTGKQSLDLWWLLAYVPPYIFSIWDSYQRTIQLNEDYKLARQMKYKINVQDFSMFGINRLDIKKPVVAVFWSLLAPGAGHIYINQIVMVIFVVPWLVIVTYFSNLLPAIHFSLIGYFELARSIIAPQWILFIPSIYGFITYDAYIHTIEYNELYKLQQKASLRNMYQNGEFYLSNLNEEGESKQCGSLPHLN